MCTCCTPVAPLAASPGGHASLGDSLWRGCRNGLLSLAQLQHYIAWRLQSGRFITVSGCAMHTHSQTHTHKRQATRSDMCLLTEFKFKLSSTAAAGHVPSILWHPMAPRTAARIDTIGEWDKRERERHIYIVKVHVFQRAMNYSFNWTYE